MKKISLFVIGLLFGAMLFGGGAAYAASGVLAERSAHTVYVDGQKKEVDAYLIDGENYFRLRDLGQMVGFEVYWDGAVQIESNKPYTGAAPVSTAVQTGPVDYSAAANPTAFVGVYSREAYNAAYEVLAGLKAGDGSRTGTVHIDNQEDRWKLENMLGNLWNGNIISIKGKGNGVFEIYSREIDLTKMDGVMYDRFQQWEALPTEREKVNAANEFICDHMVYEAGKTASALSIISAEVPIHANCMSYACTMNYLCSSLGIPCMTVSGNNHTWNLMHCEGAWSYTDVSANDKSGNHSWFLLSEQPPKELLDPEGVRFLQELLVPGSTA